MPQALIDNKHWWDNGFAASKRKDFHYIIHVIVVRDVCKYILISIHQFVLCQNNSAHEGLKQINQESPSVALVVQCEITFYVSSADSFNTLRPGISLCFVCRRRFRMMHEILQNLNRWEIPYCLHPPLESGNKLHCCQSCNLVTVSLWYTLPNIRCSIYLSEKIWYTWWSHVQEMYTTLLALFKGNPLLFSNGPEMQNFIFSLSNRTSLYKLLETESSCQWFVVRSM